MVQYAEDRNNCLRFIRVDALVSPKNENAIIVDDGANIHFLKHKLAFLDTIIKNCLVTLHAHKVKDF